MILKLFVLSSLALAKTSPPISAADYYYRHHDYAQALPLWQEVLRREPENLTAAIRVAELSLWIEGRSSLPDKLLPMISPANRKLSKENRMQLRTRFWELQNSFLTDRAQNLYLQAKHRADHGDYTGALEQLNQAADLDRGQFAILRAKANSEKQLGFWNLYYQTLRAAVRSFPYDVPTLNDIAETHIYFRNFNNAVEVLQNWEGPMDASQKTMLAIALSEEGNKAEALAMLRGLARAKAPHPVVYDVMGQLLMRSNETEKEGRKWLERFVESATEPTGWDPFRMTERLVQARRVLQSGT